MRNLIKTRGLGETNEECVRESEFDLGFDSSFGFSRHEREPRVTRTLPMI